jgi:hypothetical protein
MHVHEDPEKVRTARMGALDRESNLPLTHLGDRTTVTCSNVDWEHGLVIDNLVHTIIITSTVTNWHSSTSLQAAHCQDVSSVACLKAGNKSSTISCLIASAWRRSGSSSSRNKPSIVKREEGNKFALKGADWTTECHEC